ncbi:RNA binding protein [Arthrobacter phage KeAlii]|uniref:RNA binding protein n=1 Tax=Arthrobacter phage KeAlii TaxID=2885973 RepID=A0AA94WVS8_9CAUD|nr:RNA binding protein [Arthrobacter phage KeAlii]UDL14656.1 RNA binding protein [Arthrobacter phage KeAlii]
MRTFTDSPEDPMCEVLSEFVGDLVGITTKTGKRRYGILDTDDGDTYRLGALNYPGAVVLEVHRDDVRSVTVP